MLRDQLDTGTQSILTLGSPSPSNSTIGSQDISCVLMEQDAVAILGIHLYTVLTQDLEDIPDNLGSVFTYELEDDPEDDDDLSTLGLVTTPLGTIFLGNCLD